ncbi:M23 family metallopeptidase [Streptomyces rapamycinicus]|uniref:Murein DD-endopeptidase MepM/ murein hydrolase activator NlpD n=1 Tax=Streptomyces rapamycinicus TaxID=1226757 RepID=A0ABR6LT35_9ACTN|nr:M23 family metallopeptidase [Streptomyces rapamycinicus]MBB4784773.1 murein DD-endopeptidase MepM/ murein hydrolase activator NlpD [Streptomyces rapamycinicus]UTO65031.1 M23 family metallopeptidase [Streptomyces rapamycinicus]UTP32987.1 M23 family metallopeptidase [Streptomyces rapamycinicus NRRL 5491]
MNDRHPSGASPTVPAPDASYPYGEAYSQRQDTAHGYVGYDGYSTGNFAHLATAYGDGDPLYGDSDPLFGALPGAYDGGQGAHSGQYDASQWATADQHHQTGSYATGHYDLGHDTGHHDTGHYDTAHYDSGSYDTTAMWAASGYHLPTGIPAQQDAETGAQWDIGAWDTGATGHTEVPDQWEHGAGYEAEAYASGVDTGQTQVWDTSVYGTVDEAQYDHSGLNHPGFDQQGLDQQGFDHHSGFDQAGLDQPEHEPNAYDQTAAFEQAVIPEQPGAFEHTAVFEPVNEPDQPYDSGPGPEAEPEPEAAVMRESAPSPRREANRGRRRTPSPRPKRSALLTVAVPSVCALGVTAVAAASVSGVGSDKKDESTTQAAPDTAAAPVKPSVANSKLDSQLAGVREGADDFRDRASRTQERIDLQARQAAEKKRKAAEAARKEALRPKFALPVAQHGLSAQFGQAGINWMSVHTGIDFPVSYGTPVMAATDGTVRTQWNDAYGNMVVLTSPDGTETWYCHLSSAKIRSGTVKAGETIAYSGNSGNSTGPHLHFEVHPGGGAAIDPLPWLRGKGLDPT